MTKNNEKVSGAVHCEMSQADYNLLASYAKRSPDLQQILARARVVKDDNAPVASTKTVVKEQLTTDAVKRLFGVNYDNVCIYNNETQTLLTRKYNGADVYWDDDDTKNSRRLKELFEATFPKFELVAQATMQVSKADYPGWAEWSKGTLEFYKYGEYTVGNLIIRNKETGKLELLKAGAWFCVGWRWTQYRAARFGACLVPFAAGYPDSLAALFAGRSQR